VVERGCRCAEDFGVGRGRVVWSLWWESFERIMNCW
jgi:hypothetical protein